MCVSVVLGLLCMAVGYNLEGNKLQCYRSMQMVHSSCNNILPITRQSKPVDLHFGQPSRGKQSFLEWLTKTKVLLDTWLVSVFQTHEILPRISLQLFGTLLILLELRGPLLLTPVTAHCISFDPSKGALGLLPIDSLECTRHCLPI